MPMLTAALNALAFGIVVCDATGRLVFANAAAREIAHKGTGLTLRSRGRQVGAHTPTDKHALALRIIDAAVQGRGGVVRLTGKDGVTALPVLVTPLVQRRHQEQGAGYALLAMRAAQDKPSITEGTLTGLFQLSPTQASIAVALFDGKSAEEIAEDRGIKISTLRSHLADIFLRTGTDTQRDLIRLIGSLPPLR
jgi:DNA-binding CsgD family transcriptional regulator